MIERNMCRLGRRKEMYLISYRHFYAGEEYVWRPITSDFCAVDISESIAHCILASMVHTRSDFLV